LVVFLPDDIFFAAFRKDSSHLDRGQCLMYPVRTLTEWRGRIATLPVKWLQPHLALCLGRDVRIATVSSWMPLLLSDRAFPSVHLPTNPSQSRVI